MLYNSTFIVINKFNYSLDISDAKIRSFSLFDRLNIFVNIEIFGHIKNDRDKLEIFLMILAFNKFF